MCVRISPHFTILTFLSTIGLRRFTVLSDEVDSYMYQSVGHHAIELYAEAMGLLLFRRTIEGASVSTGQDYQKVEADEVEDLYKLLTEIKVCVLRLKACIGC